MNENFRYFYELVNYLNHLNAFSSTRTLAKDAFSCKNISAKQFIDPDNSMKMLSKFSGLIKTRERMESRAMNHIIGRQCFNSGNRFHRDFCGVIVNFPCQVSAHSLIIKNLNQAFVFQIDNLPSFLCLFFPQISLLQMKPWKVAKRTF